MRLRPFAFSDPKYWQIAQNVDVDDVIAALDAQGWEHAPFGNVEKFRRPSRERRGYDFELPRVKEEGYEAQILNGAYVLSILEDRFIDEILDDWTRATCDRVDVKPFDAVKTRTRTREVV